MLSDRALSIHKNLLRKIAKDERISPNRRLLAEMLMLHLEEVLPLPFLQDIFGKPNKIANIDKDDISIADDAISREAREALSKIYSNVSKEGDNNESSNDPASE